MAIKVVRDKVREKSLPHVLGTSIAVSTNKTLVQVALARHGAFTVAMAEENAAEGVLAFPTTAMGTAEPTTLMPDS